MDVFKAPEDLIHDVLFVDFFEDVCPDDSVEVCFHVFKDEVDVTVVFCFENVEKLDDVFVVVHFL